MPAPTPITVFGVCYPSLKAAATAFGRAPNTFHLHITSYQTEPEVVLVSSDFLSRVSFIGLNNKAYYDFPWSSSPVTAREVVAHYRPDLLGAYDAANPTGEYRPFIRRK